MNEAEFNSLTDMLAETISRALEAWMEQEVYPLPEEMVAALIRIAHSELLYMIDLVPSQPSARSTTNPERR